MRAALQGTEHLNPGLQFVQGRAVMSSEGTGTQQAITSSRRKQRLFWKLMKVDGSRCQHVRYCTPRTLKHETSLWCVFCSYDAAAWKVAGRAVLSDAELQFIVNFIVPYGLDQQSCHQVTTQFWRWPVDFWNYKQDFYIQVDGHCHWHGMHAVRKEVVQERDFSFISAANQAGAKVLRVHHADIRDTMAVLAGVDAVANGCCIVLSPSYAQVCTTHNGTTQSYVMVMHATLPHLCVRLDCHSNILFCSGQ